MYILTDPESLKITFEEIMWSISDCLPLSIWGFDFKTIRSIITAKAKQNAATADDTPITVFGNMQLYENCHQESDLTLFIYVFLKYGNMNRALADAGAAAEIVTKKFDLYKIESGTLPVHRLKNVCTLSRIARAFPVHAARLILTEKFQGVLPYSAFFKEKLPLLMQHTIFPALVPVKQFNDELKRIALVLNMEISVKLSPSVEKGNMMAKTVQDLIISSNKYINAAINSELDPDAEKLAILIKAGILEVNTDGELQLPATTVALLNKLEGIQKLVSLKYSEAVNMSVD